MVSRSPIRTVRTRAGELRRGQCWNERLAEGDQTMVSIGEQIVVS